MPWQQMTLLTLVVNMTITGGYVCAYSANNDELDANGNCYIQSGVVYVIGASGLVLAIDAITEGGYKTLYSRRYYYRYRKTPKR